MSAACYGARAVVVSDAVLAAFADENHRWP